MSSLFRWPSQPRSPRLALSRPIGFVATVPGAPSGFANQLMVASPPLLVSADAMDARVRDAHDAAEAVTLPDVDGVTPTLPDVDGVTPTLPDVDGVTPAPAAASPFRNPLVLAGIGLGLFLLLRR